MGFQAVIKSAASAASLGTKKIPKTCAKHAQNTQNMRKTCQNHQNPGLIQKLKVPKWVCRSPLASFCNGPPFFAIFGRASGQIYGKTTKKKQKIAFLVLGRRHQWPSPLQTRIPWMGFQAVMKSAASAASLGTKKSRKHAQKHAKHVQNTPKSLKSGFEPKAKSSKMGLSITPRQFL